MTEALVATDLPSRVARATGLLRHLGLTAGDRFITQLPNEPDTLALGVAAMLAGVVQVPLPRELPATQVGAIHADAAPSATVTRLDLDALDGIEPTAAWPRTRAMAYTSGTTGTRKGVSVGIHDEDWGRSFVTDEHAAFDERHGPRHLVVSPLYHSGPFRHAVVTALMGGQVAILPSFDPESLRRALVEYRPTSLFAVPTHLHRLLQLDTVDRDVLASLTLLAHAGAPCPVPLKERLLELAPEGSVWEFYGSTEGQFTVCPPGAWREAPGTVGRARPGHRLEVRDAAPDGVGTVWVHAPGHARWRYWRDDDRTRAAWDGDAFTVGDLGRLDDDGLLTLHGRPGDLLISGGVNVYPAEVERVLVDHPGVGEVVVFGTPDEDLGERVTAAIVPAPGAHLAGDEVLAWARDRLLPAQRPRSIVLVEDLPRTATGKVARVGLRDAVLGPAP